ARRLDADEADVRLIDIGMENAHGIGAAPHCRNDVIWLAAGVLGHLLQAFVTDDRLEVTHHHGIGMWAGYGTNDVEGSLYIGDPVAHGFVQGIFERARAGIDRHNGGTQQLHAINVRRLATDIFATHVHDTFQAIARSHGGRRDAMLAGARFRNNARLTQAAGQKNLTNAVIDLMRAGMVQVFALEPDLRAAQLLRPALRVVHGAGTPHKML